jgi:hypothetical protein
MCCYRRVSVASGETAVLQAQLERLESQLEKAREASVLDRQACRTAQSDFYKVLYNNCTIAIK